MIHSLLSGGCTPRPPSEPLSGSPPAALLASVRGEAFAVYALVALVLLAGRGRPAPTDPFPAAPSPFRAQ
ncbi:MAG TPA: hypothetical protein VH257_16425 [Chloroflexota bacterium]|nr:hypothetical protein [Chloroflexota bacterium]HEX2516294.1 hypothetical protein [Chloroflexota bacterium]